MIMQSVIVVGPQACGKTRNAEKIREKYGLGEVVEVDGNVIDIKLKRFGVLYLTTPDAMPWFEEDLRVIWYGEAISGIDTK